jgi:hypothetical protein
MKKLLTTILALSLCLSLLAGCGAKESETISDSLDTLSDLIPALGDADCIIYILGKQAILTDDILDKSGIIEVGSSKICGVKVLIEMPDELHNNALNILKSMDISGFSEEAPSNTAFISEVHFNAAIASDNLTAVTVDMYCGTLSDGSEMAIIKVLGDNPITLYGESSDDFKTLAEINDEVSFDVSISDANAIVTAQSDSVSKVLSRTYTASLLNVLETAVTYGDSREATNDDVFDTEVQIMGKTYDIDSTNFLVMTDVDGTDTVFDASDYTILTTYLAFATTPVDDIK